MGVVLVQKRYSFVLILAVYEQIHIVISVGVIPVKRILCVHFVCT